MNKFQKIFFKFIISFIIFYMICLTYTTKVYAQFLLPQDAFKFSAKRLPNSIEINFKIAKGYILYKEKFEFFIDDANVKITSPIFPIAKTKFDDNFKKNVEYYTTNLSIVLPILQAKDSFVLKIMAQGCAEKGICYPPTPYYYNVNLNNKNFSSSLPSHKNSNFLQKSSNNNAFSFLPNQVYKDAGLDKVPPQNKNIQITPLNLEKTSFENKKKLANEYNVDKQDHSKFYWLFIFMCIICTAIISHPSFNQTD